MKNMLCREYIMLRIIKVVRHVQVMDLMDIGVVDHVAV